ncbi:MAG: hypothetical protein Q4E65_07310 [Clostridia bacterium]|nr:hypothetical protein [Clostridia bacterium]
MTNFIVDRCYDRYIITLAQDGDAPDALLKDSEEAAAVGFVSETLLSALEEHRLAGRLRSCRVSTEADSLVVDAEAAQGYEDYLAAMVDTVTTGMCLLAERYPDAIAVEC